MSQTCTERSKECSYGGFLIITTVIRFRNKETGEWNGLIGDLVKGEIDIAVAGMTMTSEREEVVDFVAPYFDQSGISIIIRKPVRPRSLFKFLEVLRVEVWLAILGALVVTALMLWFLDKFSPYSGKNYVLFSVI